VICEYKQSTGIQQRSIVPSDEGSPTMTSSTVQYRNDNASLGGSERRTRWNKERLCQGETC